MSQTSCKQYAFSVDCEERSAFNQAVKANGLSAIAEMRRMVDDFLRDQSLFSEIVKSSRVKTVQEFPTGKVKINAHFDDLSLRRLTVSCLYADVTVSRILRGMIVAYAQTHACFSDCGRQYGAHFCYPESGEGKIQAASGAAR